MSREFFIEFREGEWVERVKVPASRPSSALCKAEEMNPAIAQRNVVITISEAQPEVLGGKAAA